jgi:hypothetical protein
LRALWPGARPAALAAPAGVRFGLVHLPALDLAAVTAVGGALWARLDLRDRLLAPLALSHAGLGATDYSGVRGEDLVARWTATLTAAPHMPVEADGCTIPDVGVSGRSVRWDRPRATAPGIAHLSEAKPWPMSCSRPADLDTAKGAVRW